MSHFRRNTKILGAYITATKDTWNTYQIQYIGTVDCTVILGN